MVNREYESISKVINEKSRDTDYYLGLKGQLHPRKQAFKITIIYGIFGAAWIAFPVKVLSYLFFDSTSLQQISIYKGWAFVALSAILIFVLTLTRLKLFEGAIKTLEVYLKIGKQIEKELNHIAYYDLLTKLPNRAMLETKCCEIINSKCQSFAFICMDVDNFKNINDTMGHTAGDQFLCHLASLLIQYSDEDTFVARLGGDEFAIIMTSINSQEEVEEKIKDMLYQLQRPWEHEGKRFIISVSMGVAIYPEHGKNLIMLLRNSDIAMYEIKKKAKNSYCFYTEELNKNNIRNIMLVNELYKAIQNEEFVLYYQPIIDIRTQKLIGVEALIRWLHPEQGMISPMDFIPLAEETGLIEDIEQWVIKTAFLQKREWDADMRDQPKLLMSINISGKSFVQYGFVNNIRKLLNQIKINSNEILLEITETVFIGKADITKKVFNDISSMGMQIALDDFGTGYSSLTYLRNFPIDIVKLDANFVKGIINQGEDRVIVESVIKLTHDLGLTIIAEGIETETQYEILKANCCDFGQGYLYSRPVPADKIKEMIKNDIFEYSY